MQGGEHGRGCRVRGEELGGVLGPSVSDQHTNEEAARDDDAGRIVHDCGIVTSRAQDTLINHFIHDAEALAQGDRLVDIAAGDVASSHVHG